METTQLNKFFLIKLIILINLILINMALSHRWTRGQGTIEAQKEREPQRTSKLTNKKY